MNGNHAVLAALAFFAAVIALATVQKSVSDPVSLGLLPRSAHRTLGRRFGGAEQRMVRTGGLARVRQTAALTASLTERKGMPLAAAEKVAYTVGKVQSLGCAAPSSDYGDARKQADSNWWGAIKAFATADEVEASVTADPDHPHVLIFLAPGWCHWSQKQVQDLQKSFNQLGEARQRIHLIDVDDEANEALVAFQGVTSFPTVVVVQGDDVLMNLPGYKEFDMIKDLAQADTGSAPISPSPGASPF